MKKLLLAITAALALGACSDFEASDNGKLDGFWQMTSIDTLINGRSGNMTSRMIFWSIQAGLVELSDRHEGEPYNQRYPSIFYRFERSTDTLSLLGDPKPRVNSRVMGDRDVAGPMECGYYGLNSEGEKLQILYLKEKKMALQSEHFRMYFRKF